MSSIWSAVKNFLKIFFPVTIRRFNQELWQMQDTFQKTVTKQQQTLTSLETSIFSLQQSLDNLEQRQREIAGQRDITWKSYQTEISQILETTLQETEEKYANLYRISETQSQEMEEKYSNLYRILETTLQGTGKNYADLSRIIDMGIGDVKRVIHGRSDRLEKCMIHCIPRAELSFEVALVEHCDLNCAGCDHFSPLAEPEFADLNEFTHDFARISELFHGHAKEIHLLGGEPLLHPDLTSFLAVARQYFPDAVIDITTNGLKLLHQSEEFWEVCRENNIVIRPTKYPVQLDFEEMEEKAVEYGVKYRYFGNTGTILKTSDHYRFDLEGLQDGNRNFLLCHRANTCVYLQHGKLYTCTIAPTMRHFNKYFGKDLKERPEDSIDIYTANSAREIMEFLAKPIPFCRYCMIDKTEWKQPWHQSKRTIEEWT